MNFLLKVGGLRGGVKWQMNWLTLLIYNFPKLFHQTMQPIRFLCINKANINRIGSKGVS